MKGAKKSQLILPDKTVTIDGETHETLRVKAFETGGKETLKSLIAEAVKAKFGQNKPRV